MIFIIWYFLVYSVLPRKLFLFVVVCCSLKSDLLIWITNALISNHKSATVGTKFWFSARRYLFRHSSITFEKHSFVPNSVWSKLEAWCFSSLLFILIGAFSSDGLQMTFSSICQWTNIDPIFFLISNDYKGVFHSFEDACGWFLVLLTSFSTFFLSLIVALLSSWTFFCS